MFNENRGLKAPRLVHICLLILIYLTPWIASSGQPSSYNLVQYTSNNGLPQNSVMGISFDRDGLLWLATQGGICSFDGQNFRYYNQFNTPVFKSSRFIGFYPGDDANLVAVDELWNLYSISNDGVRQIFRPKLNNLAESFPKGLIGNGHALFFDRLPQNKNWSKHQGVTVVMDNCEAYIQMGKDLYFLNNKKNLIQDLNIPCWGLTNFQPAFVFEDLLVHCNEKEGYVYCHGKHLTNLKFSATFRYVIKNFAQYKGKSLNSPLVMAGKDIYKIVRRGDTLDASLLASNIPIDPVYNITCSLYDSSRNVICLGTNTNGLYFLTKTNISFVPVGVLDEVTSLGQGSFFGDDLKFDVHTKKWTKTKDSLQHTTLFKTHDSWLWGSVKGMLSKASPGSTNFSPVQKLHEFGCSFSDKELSLTCFDYAIWKLKPDGKFGKMLDIAMNPTFMFRESSNIFWLVDHQDVFEYDIRQNKLSEWPLFTSRSVIRDIFRAKNGTVWLTSYGMGMYAWMGGKLLPLPADPSACLRYAHNIYEDQKGFFWIPTNNGLIQCRRDELEAYAQDSSVHPFFYRYGLADGLVTNEFNGGRASPYDSTKQGELIFPSMKGAIFFSPLLLNPNTGSGIFTIESIYINDTTIRQKLGEDIHIDPDFEKIIVKIGYPYYGDFNNVVLEYNLEGLNNRWYTIGPERLVILNRLPHGAYNLVIRKKNGFGINSYSYKKITFTVLPRVFETEWFTASLIACVVLITIILNRTRHFSHLRQKRLLEKTVNERTSELTDSVERLNRMVKRLNESEQKLSEANRLKEHTIAIILHDIKTPLQYLNLVATDLKTEVGRMTKDQLGDFTSAFSDTLRQTNAFVEDLLQWLLSQQEGFRPNYSRFQIGELFKEIEGVYGDVVKSRDNSLKVYKSSNHTILYTDRNMLKLIIRNLVDNANKHTSRGVIELLTYSHEDSVDLVIRDTGRGMTKEQLNYVNGPVADNDMFKDSRLGLSLIGKFINLINGSILFEGTPGGGTTIVINLKIGDRP